MITLSILFIASLGACVYFARRAYMLAGFLADEQDYINSVENTNRYMFGQIEKSYDAMKQIDRLGAFESEDEAGTTFNMLKQVITELKEEFDGNEASEEK